MRNMEALTVFSLVAAHFLEFSFVRASDGSTGSTNHNWYQRYQYYPPYCSTPKEMDRRSVPPLQDDDHYGESKIAHVTAVIRHGARTPWGHMPCWEGYLSNPETAVWNCNLTTFVSPPPADRVQREETMAALQDDAQGMFLFEKHYNALQHPTWNLSNIFNGTCQKGQLILQGYEQEIANGQHLQQAYVYDSSQKKSASSDPRMHLLDTHSSSEPWQEDFYMRADDEQRTVMSGQLILRGLYGPQLQSYVQQHQRYPIIPLHTADYSRDVVAPNHEICPRLAEIAQRVQQTWDYQRFNTSREVNTLRQFQQQVLGMKQDGNIDCLMTTICTDRPLPDAIDDYTGGDEASELGMTLPPEGSYGDNLFLRLYNFYVKQYTLIATYNNSEYSEVAMAPLWAEIMDNINAVVQDEPTVAYPEERPTPKLALFSGHDTTLLPLLASLPGVYDNKWPPYASMLLLEVHELNIDGRKNKKKYPTDYGFRLIYNGQVLTKFVSGCPQDADVCDVSVLQRHVSKFATRQRDCRRQHADPQVLAPQAVLSSELGVAAILLLVMGSAAMGALVTLCVLGCPQNRQHRPARRKYAAAGRHEEEEEERDGIIVTARGSAEYTDRDDQEEYQGEVQAVRANVINQDPSVSAMLT